MTISYLITVLLHNHVVYSYVPDSLEVNKYCYFCQVFYYILCYIKLNIDDVTIDPDINIKQPASNQHYYPALILWEASKTYHD